LLDKTAGEPEKHGPEAVLMGPVDQSIQFGQD
jgi:hypothetical protein